MYSGYGFREFEIGDVGVVKHDGLYHLFHLILPNHDYIAHAVSEDGLRWRRVQNALFIGDPGSWDDDMLWTMHVSEDPYRPGGWRMFYTGLCMAQGGRVQRIGLARSDDLYRWEKDSSDRFPLEIPEGTGYEHSLEEGRGWVSFRDPFCFPAGGQAQLVAAARVNRGPVIRRGCVARLTETREGHFEFQPPIHHPMQYDDVEVPCVIELDERFYLIGSIREDVKVHYWYADSLEGPYRNYHDNVLLPQGNYAARVSRDGEKWLIWNFFYKGLTVSGQRMLAPPKELVTNERGELRLKSFAGFDSQVSEKLTTADIPNLTPLFGNPHATGETETTSCWFGCESGFEAFLLPGEYDNFMLAGDLHLEGNGKCGLVFRLDDEGDGYYLSLDLFKGIAQIRAWSHKPDGGIEEAFSYDQLQGAFYVPDPDPQAAPIHFRLLAYEQYLEFSLGGHVLLTLADDRFDRGRVGFYVESTRLRVEDLELRVCQRPQTESYPMDIANF